jgi:hypothetical protein
MREKRLMFLWPVLLGMLFCLQYLRIATADVPISDYIRLTISYLPDVTNPAKFFVPDILTRAPLTYLFRIINVRFFGYNTEFDMVLGVLSLTLGALAFAAWARKREVPYGWFLIFCVIWFGLNKWEMLGNGTGWVCFLSISGFLFHYAVLDRAAATGCRSKCDRVLLIALPPVLTFLVTGVYCAAYLVILFALYALLAGFEAGKRRENRENALALRTWIGGFLSALVSLLVFLVSKHFAVWVYEDASDITAGELFQENPLFFVRFFLKSFASDWVDNERLAEFVNHHQIHGGELVLLAGAGILFLYVAALCVNLFAGLWRESILPLALILYSGFSHVLVLVSRVRFLKDTYGMSSRYAIQYEMGMIGILLTFALLFKLYRGAWRRALFAAMTFVTALILAGSLWTTVQEYQHGQYRKEFLEVSREVAMNYRNETDKRLKDYLQRSPDSVREAMRILEENHLSVFRNQ